MGRLTSRSTNAAPSIDAVSFTFNETRSIVMLCLPPPSSCIARSMLSSFWGEQTGKRTGLLSLQTITGGNSRCQLSVFRCSMDAAKDCSEEQSKPSEVRTDRLVSVEVVWCLPKMSQNCC